MYRTSESFDASSLKCLKNANPGDYVRLFRKSKFAYVDVGMMVAGMYRTSTTMNHSIVKIAKTTEGVSQFTNVETFVPYLNTRRACTGNSDASQHV